LINNDPSETYVEYIFNTFASIEDIIISSDDMVHHEQTINNAFKITNDYERIIDEINRIDNHDDISYTNSAPLTHEV
jgi:hypothetical protein